MRAQTFLHRLSFWPLLLLAMTHSAHADERTFSVGISLPLSGAFEEYGVAIRNGIELSREDYPQSRQNVRFIFEDDAYDPKRGIIAFEKFRSIGVNAVFAWGIEPIRAIAPLAERSQLPTVVGSLDPEASRGKRYVIGAFLPYREYSCQLMAELAKNGKFRLGYIRSEVSLFRGLTDAAKDCLQPGQSLVELETFLPSEQDFRAEILSLRTKSYDAIGVYLTSPQLMNFFQQASIQRFQSQFFGPTLFYDRNLLKQSSAILSGALLTHNVAASEFVKRYVERFGNDTHIGYAAHAYEITKIFLTRFQQPRSWTRDAVLETLTKTIEPTPSVAGTYRITTHPEGGYFFTFPAAVYRITQDGIYEKVSESH